MTAAPQSLGSKAITGGRWTAIAGLGTFALQIAQFVILGRLLGPSEFGLMAMMMVVIGLTNSVADFGVGNYLIQKDTLNKGTVYRLMMTVIGVSTLLATVIALMSSLVADFFKQPSLTELLPWLSISIVALAVSQLLMSVLQRFVAFRQIAIAEITAAALAFMTTSLLASASYGIWALLAGQIVAGCARGVIFAIPLGGIIRKLPRGDDDNLSNATSFALYQTGERCLDYLASNSDKIIAGRILGDVALGVYSVAYQLMIKPLTVLNPIFTRVALPLLVSIRDDNVRLATGYLQLVKTISLIMFPLYLVLAFCAPTIVNFLLGNKWAEAAPILYVLSLTGIFLAIGNPIGTLVVAKAKPKITFYLNLLSTIIYAAAFWIGSSYSALGVAVAFLVTAACIFFPLHFYVRARLIGMSSIQYLRAMGHMFAAAAVPIVAHAVFFYPGMESDSVTSQIIVAVSSICFFFGYLYIFDRKFITIICALIFDRKRSL